MISLATVYVLDTDPISRTNICTAIHHLDATVNALTSFEGFLADKSYLEPGCLLYTIHDESPNESGANDSILMMQQMVAVESVMPVIFLSTTSSIKQAVAAMRAGALNYLFNPCSGYELRIAIEEAFTFNTQGRLAQAENEDMNRRMEKLTNAELRTLEMVIVGRPNKVVARHLDVSQRTVERMRSSIIKKLGVHTTAEVVHKVTKFRTHCTHRRLRQAKPHLHFQSDQPAVENSEMATS